MTKEKILSYLQEHKENFYDRYGITNIALFGSYAKGCATESSDIDILIEMEDGIKDIHDKKEHFRDTLQKAFGKKVDIARAKYLKKLAKDEIEKDLCYA